MGDNDINDRLSQLTSASTFLITSGALSVLAYGLAWIFVTRFLSPFGVTPEEIGISPTWILFRAPLLALPFIGFALALWAIFQARRIVSPSTSRVFEILVGFLVVGLILVVYFSPPFRPVRDLIIIITYLSFIGLLISVATWWLHRKSRAFIVSFSLALLFALSSVFWMWTGAAEGADYVVEGGSGSFTVLGRWCPMGVWLVADHGR